MESESDELVKKILKHLKPILKQIFLLDDFAIIPTSVADRDRNICPVKYVPLERCLGLESWCVSYMFKYLQRQIFKLRKGTVRKPTADSVEILNDYLNVALLLQPEVATFWNIKRELDLDFVTEMHFTRLLLSHKPKTLQAYNYRVWLINKASNVTFVNWVMILEQELSVIDKACSSCPNNYHAWNQRIWCVENLIPKLSADFMYFEWSYSEQYIHLHVSDYSCFHYRQFVLRQYKEKFIWYSNLANQQFVDEFNNQSQCMIYSLLHAEYLNRLEEAQITRCDRYVSCLFYELLNVLLILHKTFPGHESIWYHRRFVLREMFSVLLMIYAVHWDNKNKFELSIELPTYLNVIYSNLPLKSADNNNKRLLALKSSPLYQKVFAKESETLEMLMQKSRHNSVEIDLIHKHKKWLEYVMRAI